MSGKTNDFEKVKGNVLQFEDQSKDSDNRWCCSLPPILLLNVTKADVATIYISMATNFSEL